MFSDIDNISDNLNNLFLYINNIVDNLKSANLLDFDIFSDIILVKSYQSGIAIKKNYSLFFNSFQLLSAHTNVYTYQCIGKNEKNMELNFLTVLSKKLTMLLGSVSNDHRSSDDSGKI